MLLEVSYLHIKKRKILQSAGSFIIDSNSLSVAELKQLHIIDFPSF